MKVYELIYSIKKRQKKIKIFNPDFVEKYKNKFKIVYNSKIYPLKSKFDNNANNISEKFKIKLITFSNLPEQGFILFGIDSLIQFYKCKINKTRSKEYKEIIERNFEISKMTYKINLKENNIKIFGKNFVKRNKEKCKIVYKNNILPLKEYIPIEEIEKGKINKLEIYLIELEDITDRSYMFHNCKLLEEISFFNESIEVNQKNDIINSKSRDNDIYSENKIGDIKDENNIIQRNNAYNENIYDLINRFISVNKYVILDYNFSTEISMFDPEEPSFAKQKSFEELEGSKDVKTYIKDIEDLLKFTYSFSNSPRFKIKNITRICHMFEGCSSLINLPNISYWNTEKIIIMNSLFNGCSSLLSLPDISKWNTTNVTEMDRLFRNC